MKNNGLIATFIGHRDVYLSNSTRKKIRKALKETIESGVLTFYCGAQGAFDSTCAVILKELKEYFPTIKVYVVTPYFNESYLKELDLLVQDGYYDGIITPPIEHIPPKYAILARNKYMIDKSIILFAYVDYSIGGAYATYKYAKNKKFIDIYNFGALEDAELDDSLEN
ncbi:MAG: DUF1273 family protein [Clostridia bacterium]|nr:DUF1273 family protein [Clostridia bacterium]